MRLPGLEPGAWICVSCSSSSFLTIERQFTCSPASGYWQPPASTGLRAARLAPGRPWA